MDSGRPTTLTPPESRLSTIPSYSFELKEYSTTENKAIIKLNGQEYDVAIKLKSGRNNGFSLNQWFDLTSKIEILFNQAIRPSQTFQQSTITKDAILLTSNGLTTTTKVNDAFKLMNPIVTRSFISNDDFGTGEYGYGSTTPPLLAHRGEYTNTASNSSPFPPNSNQSNTPYPSRSFPDHSHFGLRRQQSPAASHERNNGLDNSFDHLDFQYNNSQDWLDSPPLLLNPSNGTLGAAQTQRHFSTTPFGSSYDSANPFVNRSAASPTTTTTTSTSTTTTPSFNTPSFATPTPPQTPIIPAPASANSSATATVTSSAVPKSNDLLNFDDDETESITLTLRPNVPAASKPDRFTSIEYLFDTPTDFQPSTPMLIPTRSGEGNEETHTLQKDDENEKKTEGNSGVPIASKEGDEEEKDQVEESTVPIPTPQPTTGLWSFINTATRVSVGVATLGGSEAIRFGYNWWNKPKATEDTSVTDQTDEGSDIELEENNGSDTETEEKDRISQTSDDNESETD